MIDDVPGRPWHNYIRAFNAALREDDIDAFRATLHLALAGDQVVEDVDAGLLIDTNALGRSYNAMGQSTLGIHLIEAGLAWDVPKWVGGGRAALDVLLTPYAAGGLGLLEFETETAWFVGRTGRESASKGGTINKHLYATRTLLEAADLLAETAPGRAALYQRAGEAGFRKLALGDAGPKLADFFVREEDGDAFLDSWVYYSLIDANPERPYFLRDQGLNGHYHTYDMTLIHQISRLLDEGFDYEPFLEETVGGLTALSAMVQVWEAKLDTGGPLVDTPTPLGRFHGWHPEKGRPPTQEGLLWFERFRTETRIEGGAEADRLRGTNADEILMGREGDDLLRGGRGDDRMRGGDGDDLASGGGGADSLHGGSGDDTLVGGGGADDLIGGAGADVFAFVGGPADLVRDFKPGDRLAIDDRLLGGDAASEPRPLSADAFGTLVLYDAESGTLSLDPGGPDGAAPRLLATLSGAPAVTAADLLLF
ncbi:calcium-binding protein [Jannaschia seohaensis]|uniref:Hemolysin type calcium-binding protein n=1 Tax=Jannaschia seohaensis TaxID=475081 RepID=A0A2Y9ABT2_9RHOB|nr:calcium-binding protein [Jannaschia seohaensis]PWJ20996.1 hemolysin type calcium-binding protein [Jannaschia seohaensis]SSA41406.1 Hemolysin-type calcium-binding repeat-containing protein [Jannaschia seohaensis]